MKQTWRWFGPADTIPITALPQAGVEGVVSALHQVAPGDVWTIEDIRARQHQIAHGPDGAPTGLTWDVVESLPVSETIKTQGPDLRAHLDAWRQSLRHLARCGIEVVCYNFMPILDWTRTDLRAPQPHGGTAMHFDLLDFAAFDLHILARPGAAQDYDDDFRDAAAERFAAMPQARRAEMTENVVKGLPGAADHWSLDDIRARLSTYDGIGPERLRGHLVDFLSEVAPLAQELGLRLCCHPDDPPFSLLGLPRIMSCADDYAAVMDAVDIPANGITFCTGSLGVAPDFDGAEFVRRLGGRIHFVHLRNTTRHGPAQRAMTSFHEAEHLGGDTDMVATIAALLAEEDRRRDAGRADAEIPMRPDHGQDILDDLTRASMPGYPLIGRMRGLAELRGVMHGLRGR